MSNQQTNWTLNYDHARKQGFKTVRNSYPREFESVFSNLDKVMQILESGHKLGSFRLGFFRSEGKGLYRVGQSGVKNSQEIRLYVFPDVESKTMYVLSTETKRTPRQQTKDINSLHHLIGKI